MIYLDLKANIQKQTSFHPILNLENLQWRFQQKWNNEVLPRAGCIKFCGSTLKILKKTKLSSSETFAIGFSFPLNQSTIQLSNYVKTDNDTKYMSIDARQTDSKIGKNFHRETFQWKVFTVNLSSKEFEGSEFGGHCSEVSLTASDTSAQQC